MTPSIEKYLVTSAQTVLLSISLILKLKIEILECGILWGIFSMPHIMQLNTFSFISVCIRYSSAKANRNIGSQVGGLGYMCVHISPIIQNFVFSCQNTILRGLGGPQPEDGQNRVLCCF